MKILRATEKQLDQLVPLFNGYRMFYKQPDNLEKAKDFLKDRFQKSDSVIFRLGDGFGSWIQFDLLDFWE